MTNKILAFLFIVTFFLFSLGQLGRVSFLNQEINVYFYEVTMFISLLFLYFRYGSKPVKNSLTKDIIIVFFLASLLVSYLLSISMFGFHENLVTFLYFLRLILYLIYFLYLGTYLRKEDKSGKIFSLSLTVFVAITLISSFIQYALYPDLRNLLYLGWDPHLNRMFGLFFDTSVAGAVYGLLFLYFLKKNKRTIFFLFLASVILTFSRATYLALFIVLLSLFASRKLFAYLILIFGLALIIFLAAPKQFGYGVGLARTVSIFSRINDYKESFLLWERNPVFGIGYNRLGYVRNVPLQNGIPSHSRASLSSSYLIILATGGLVGLVLFLASIWKIIATNRKTVFLLGFVAILSLFDNIILHPFIMFLLGVFLCNPITADSSR